MGQPALHLVTSTSWEDVVSRAQAGSRAHQEQLVRAVGPRVSTMLRRTLGPDPEHADLVQDALAELLRMLPRLREPSQLVAFAERIAVNLARSRLRRRRVLRFFGFGDLSGSGDDDDEFEQQLPGGTGVDVEARAALRELEAALDELPADERLAFVLRHVEQHTLEDTAARLGCSLATAKRRLTSCEHRLAPLTARSSALSAWLEKRP